MPKRKLDSDNAHSSLEQRQRNLNDYFKRQRSCNRLHFIHYYAVMLCNFV